MYLQELGNASLTACSKTNYHIELLHELTSEVVQQDQMFLFRLQVPTQTMALK